MEGGVVWSREDNCGGNGGVGVGKYRNGRMAKGNGQYGMKL